MSSVFCRSLFVLFFALAPLSLAACAGGTATVRAGRGGVGVSARGTMPGRNIGVHTRTGYIGQPVYQNGTVVQTGVAGCSEQWVQMPMLIGFPTASADMGYQNREILREMVRSAQSRNDLVAVRVEGHTDRCGNEYNNMSLSQARASAVAAELVHMGVPSDRVTSVGYGSSRPRTNENCGAHQGLSRQTNRRVEFSLLVCRNYTSGAPAVQTMY